jgi:predicted nucleotidyltransferase
MDALRKVLADDPCVSYALVFGSSARGTAHEGSDLDIAVGLESPARLSALELGDLIARLERASGRSVDIVVVDEAPLRRWRIDTFSNGSWPTGYGLHPVCET